LSSLRWSSMLAGYLFLTGTGIHVRENFNSPSVPTAGWQQIGAKVEHGVSIERTIVRFKNISAARWFAHDNTRDYSQQ
jgi:hypothetical protein